MGTDEKEGDEKGAPDISFRLSVPIREIRGSRLRIYEIIRLICGSACEFTA
jgi:hypothetical protein